MASNSLTSANLSDVFNLLLLDAFKKLALLLNQMAEALTSILHQSRAVAAQSSKAEQDGEEFTSGDLGEFEDLIQDWLASVYVSWDGRRGKEGQLTLTNARTFVPPDGAGHSIDAAEGCTVPSAGIATSHPDSGTLFCAGWRSQCSSGWEGVIFNANSSNGHGNPRCKRPIARLWRAISKCS